jgi:hypothetical protein
MNENGVIFLFGRVADDLHMYIEEIKPGFPDCVARRFTGKGWERVLIEFEYLSSNFQQHGHNPEECDTIVCWEHDWKECPIEVIELKSEILEMKNPPVLKPGIDDEPDVPPETALKELFDTQRVSPKIQEYYHQLDRALREWNEEIWSNIGRKYIGFHSPEKMFALMKPRPSSLAIKCFSRGEPLPGTKVANIKFSPRWAKFTVKQEEQINSALIILKESHSKLKAAMKAGELTGYFSGGKRPTRDKSVEDEDEEEDSESS